MSALREIKSFQRPGEPLRRWFNCEFADLIIFEFVLHALRGW